MAVAIVAVEHSAGRRDELGHVEDHAVVELQHPVVLPHHAGMAAVQPPQHRAQARVSLRLGDLGPQRAGDEWARRRLLQRDECEEPLHTVGHVRGAAARMQAPGPQQLEPGGGVCPVARVPARWFPRARPLLGSECGGAGHRAPREASEAGQGRRPEIVAEA